MENRGRVPAEKPIVCLVDDDPAVRKSVSRLLRAEDFEVRAYAAARDFLEAGLPDGDSCLVLDLFMPEIDGLELQEMLSTEGKRISIVFISGQGDIPSSVRAMKAGAVDFLPKPFGRKELLEAIGQAIDKDHTDRRVEMEIAALRERYDQLTPREREILKLLAEGNSVKEIAVILGLSVKTVEAHKFNLMRKLDIHNKAQLVTYAIQKKIIKIPVNQ